MAYSQFLQRRWLKNAFIDRPVYLALFVSVSSELAALGYSRKVVPCQLFSSIPVVVRNPSAVVLGPALQNWGTITHLALYDAPTGGNLLVPPTPLGSPAVVLIGGSYTIEANGLELRV